jgi:hypothetical protein
MLDRWEPWSLRRLYRWRPELDAALLIGYPFSPAAVASRRLAAAGVPYVLDAGDPWALTSAVHLNSHVGLWRARRAERRVLGGAAGVVLTTPQQAGELRQLYADLPILVRPNGYRPDLAPAPGPRRPAEPAHLRLVHFGMLSAARIDPASALRRLLADGPWNMVTLAQFGGDYAGMLDRLPEGIRVERHSPRPWDQVVEVARDFDLALALGNLNGVQLPSKAIQYLTLPIPRLALTGPIEDDALADYVADLPGWLAVSSDDPALASLVARHLRRDWTPDALQPPTEEAWPAVAGQVVDFVERKTLHAALETRPMAAAGAGAREGQRP